MCKENPVRYSFAVGEAWMSSLGMGASQNIARSGIGGSTQNMAGAFSAARQRLEAQLAGSGTEASKGIASAGDALAAALDEVASKISSRASVFAPP